MIDLMSCSAESHGPPPARRNIAHKDATQDRVGDSVFLLLFYAYVWLVIDPRLLHHALGLFCPYHCVSFAPDWPFFWECVCRPGGFSDYAARFFWQFFRFGWAGALILTAAAWGMGIAIGMLGRIVEPPPGIVVRFGPAVFLAVICGRYEQPLKTTLSLLIALSWFTAYLRWGARGGTGRSGVLLAVICVVAYILAGSGGLLTPCLVAVFEFLHCRRRHLGVIALLCMVGVPFLVDTAFFRTPFSEESWTFLLSDDQAGRPNWLFGGLYVYFPAVLLGAIWNRRRQASSRVSTQGGRKKTNPVWKKWISRILQAERPRFEIGLAAICVTTAVIAWSTLDRDRKLVLQVDYYCQHGNWEEALESADHLPGGKVRPDVNRNILLALCRTGRLLDEMFRYPQEIGQGYYRLIASEPNLLDYAQDSRVFLELGQVNFAEKCCIEALVVSGERPSILKQLAVICIVKGLPDTAKVFLNRLGKTLFHRREAEEMLKRIEQDSRMEGDPVVDRLRSIMTHKDHASIDANWEELLLGQLKEKPDNRAAFEFLAAFYLRSLQVDKIVENLPSLWRCGYNRIPQLLQEAILVQSTRANGRLAVPEEQIAPQTFQRAKLFSAIFSRFPDRQEAARVSAEAGLSGSYFHYLGG